MYFPHNEIIVRNDGLAKVKATVALLPPSSSIEQIIVAESLAEIGAIKTTPVTAYITPNRLAIVPEVARTRYGKPPVNQGLGDFTKSKLKKLKSRLTEKQQQDAIAREEAGIESAIDVNLLPGGYTPEEIRGSKVWKRHMRVTITERAPGEKMYLDTDLGSGANIRRMKNRAAHPLKHPILAIIYPKVLNKQPLTGAEALYHIAVILRRKRRRRRHKARLKKSLTGVLIVAGALVITVVTFGAAPVIAAVGTGASTAGSAVLTAAGAAGSAALTATGAAVSVIGTAGGAVISVVGAGAKAYDKLPEKQKEKIEKKVEEKFKDEAQEAIDKQKQETQEMVDVATGTPAPGAGVPAIIKKLPKAVKVAAVAVPTIGILGTLAWYLTRR